MEIKVGEFEGPYELLFHLIEKNKIDIRDIPIAFIADQFIQYVEEMQSKNMNELSEFILMTATLLEIKSKILLPVKEVDEKGEEIDPRAELVERLLEYKRAKNFANLLKEQAINSVYAKNPEKNVIMTLSKNYNTSVDSLLGEVTLHDLTKIFNTVVLRMDSKVDKIRKDFNSIKKDEYTIENRTEYILRKLENLKNISFISLFVDTATKSEKVTTFLAVLELIKIKKITVEQDNIFEDIIIRGNTCA